MKNYPNQASSFSRLRDTLATIRTLNSTAQNASDDGVLGYELARRGYYTFRYLDSTTATQAQLEERIAAEQRKSKGSQGARTNAREMRRTLRTMGWVDGNGAVTAAGDAVLSSRPGSLEERALLAQGLLNIETEDMSGTSHPVRVMLRLLSVRPSQHRDGLELALEARDDSDAEFDRVKRLYALNPTERQSGLGISDFQRDNARKIFPTLAKTAGLVIEDSTGQFHLSPDGRAVLGLTVPRVESEILARARRKASTGRKVTVDTVAPKGAPGISRALSAEEQARAKQLLSERTDAHQELVRRTARLIAKAQLPTPSGALYEDPLSYDLLWVLDDPSSPGVLMEMKTIAGDAAAQCRLAVGQLSYYHFFEVSPNWPDRGVAQVMVTDGELSLDLIGYLDSEEIAVVCYRKDGKPKGLNEAGTELLEQLQRN